MWLRDFLPQNLPNVRILTFGYDSALQNSSSMISINDFARQHLELVSKARSGDEKVVLMAGLSFHPLALTNPAIGEISSNNFS